MLDDRIDEYLQTRLVQVQSECESYDCCKSRIIDELLDAISFIRELEPKEVMMVS